MNRKIWFALTAALAVMLIKAWPTLAGWKAVCPLWPCPFCK